MIKPLVIGNKTFPVNIIQGPLAGISCAPFRLLTWRYSQPAFSCTEMISSKTIIYQPSLAQQRYINKHPQEGPVSFQLSANDPTELGEATKRVTDYGADLIDLNCGCPVNKIRSKGAGSSLLMNPSKLYQLITAMKNNTTMPVSVKIRIEGGSNDKFNQEIATVISDAGADLLTVHGRHWTEHYETPCNYEQIQFFVETLKIPVIGNGDIFCIDTLKKMFSTGCAGVMIGRAGVGQPWLIKKLIAQMQDTSPTLPSLEEIGKVFIEHVYMLVDLLGNEKLAILQARKFAKYYARDLAERMAFNTAVNDCHSLSDLVDLSKAYFKTRP